MSRTPEQERERAQSDFSSTKDNLLGPSRRTPWAGLESDETYQKRLDAYNDTFDDCCEEYDNR